MTQTHGQVVRPAKVDRAIVVRSRGTRHGPIVRLVSPTELGPMLKPFVFLDWTEILQVQSIAFAPHPHSGIATLTVFLDGMMNYADTTGKSGFLMPGSVEWMKAGRGVWHSGGVLQGPVSGFQLWLALGPDEELGDPQSLYFASEELAAVGPARVILGQYQGVGSPIPYSAPVTYLHVKLDAGETWTFHPPPEHHGAWLAIGRGELEAGGALLAHEIAVFEEGSAAIAVVARTEAEFVIASAALQAHPYPLVIGPYSVHTSEDGLEKGHRAIASLRGDAQQLILPAAS